MGKYLLTAPDDDLAAWKAAAKARGVTFAAFARNALDAACGRRSAPPPDAGKRSYAPDFKGGRPPS